MERQESKELKLKGRGEPKHLVLVHGAGHGAWCWYKVRLLLEKKGHRVTCLDLVGAGVDATDPSSVRTFEEYFRPLSDLLAGLSDQDGDKVVLVGHSAGGLSLTKAAHEFGPKIAVAVYIAATMFRNGLSSPTEADAGATNWKHFKDEDINEQKKPRGIQEEFQRKFLYNMSPEEDQILASMLLRLSIPNEAFQGVRFHNDEEADKVRRVYVKTAQDRLFAAARQDAMIRLWPPAQVYTLDCDHSPFFSAPAELCDVLLHIMDCIP